MRYHGYHWNISAFNQRGNVESLTVAVSSQLSKLSGTLVDDLWSVQAGVISWSKGPGSAPPPATTYRRKRYQLATVMLGQNAATKITTNRRCQPPNWNTETWSRKNENNGLCYYDTETYCSIVWGISLGGNQKLFWILNSTTYSNVEYPFTKW